MAKWSLWHKQLLDAPEESICRLEEKINTSDLDEPQSMEENIDTWYIGNENNDKDNRTGKRKNYLVFLRRMRPLVLPDLIDMLKFRHGIMVRLSRKFEVMNRLKDVVTGCGESYVEGV